MADGSGSGRRYGSGTDESAGIRMLAAGGIDPSAVASDLRAVEAAAAERAAAGAHSLEPLGLTDVEGYLEHQQRMIAEMAVRDAIVSATYGYKFLLQALIGFMSLQRAPMH